MNRVIIISELAAGGVERVNYLLSKGLSATNRVTTLSIKGVGKEKIHDIDYEVLGKSSGKKAIRSIIKYLRSEKPDWIITCDHTSAFCAVMYKKLYNSKCKCMFIVHSVYSSMFYYKPKSKLLIQHYIPKLLNLYNECDAIVYVSQGVKEDFKKLYTINKSKEYVIFNPVFLRMPILREKRELKGNIKLVTVGRLATEKRQKYLIEAVAVLREKAIEAELFIYGEGLLKIELEKFANELKVEKQIHFCGFCENVIDELHKYDVFCLTSEFESFGNVIVEAMGAKLPVICMDCPVGPREILDNGNYGVLTPNTKEDFIRQLEILLRGGVDYDVVDKAYKKSRDFSLKVVIEKYKQVINNA